MQLCAVERLVERVERQRVTEQHPVHPAVCRIDKVPQRLDEGPLAVHRLVELLGCEGPGPLDVPAHNSSRMSQASRNPPASVGRIFTRCGMRRSSSASTSEATSTPLSRTSCLAVDVYVDQRNAAHHDTAERSREEEVRKKQGARKDEEAHRCRSNPAGRSEGPVNSLSFNTY